MDNETGVGVLNGPWRRAVTRAASIWLWGFRRQKPNNYGEREHEEPRYQMPSGIRVGLDYILNQKRQAAKGQ